MEGIDILEILYILKCAFYSAVMEERDLLNEDFILVLDLLNISEDIKGRIEKELKIVPSSKGIVKFKR